ncbi:MAG TPA: hypothetical protein VFP50_07525 [Anaeromyxobacteraceae bacterium]|nr:hypothetical protein [Anaeromyxobacteraceae bacterium]
MLLRRSVPFALAGLALAACEPSISQRVQPDATNPVDAAVFDPTNSLIPLPNDLALASIPTGVPCAALPSAQAQFLCAFKAAGGFPNDQEVPITISFTRSVFDPATNTTTTSAAPLDLSTVRFFGADAAPTVALIRVDGTPAPVIPATPVAADYAAGAARGTLTLHATPDATGSRRWPAGAKFVVAFRGGPNGLKTTDGRPVSAAPTMFVLVQAAVADANLTLPQNQGLLPGTAAEKAAAGAQLEPIRAGVVKPALAAVAAAWPAGETASVQTFAVAPTSATSPTIVEFDQSKGSLPLPNDMLRDQATGNISATAACALAGGTFAAATQTCSTPASAGFKAMDGFSTTAMAVAATSSTIDAATVNAANVFLFKLSPTAAPVLVKDLAGALGAGTPAAAGYVLEPSPIVAACPIASGKCSSAIGLQPAVPAPVPGVGTFYLPPLDGATSYAVVITNRVKDVTGKPLGRSTFAKLLLEVTQPVVAGGKSLVGGLDDATAASVAAMKADLAPVFTSLPSGTTVADVAMAYSFRTQNTTGASLQLAAAPYAIEQAANKAIFAVTSVQAATSPIPAPNVAAYFEIQFNSLDLIDKTTGALRATLAADLANPTVVPTLVKPLKALVAMPFDVNVPFCSGTAGPRCAKVAVVGHGINGDKQLLFALANELALHGYLVVATDFPLHGDRAWCKADAECGTGGVCTPFPGGQFQGDATPPGTCTTGKPISAISGQFYVSGNFFRLRDANRQNVFDQSALVLAMARPPAPFPQPATDARAALVPANVIIDPSEVRYESISLGSIGGTMVFATNPRFDRGALSVGGGTFVDIGNNSPAFQPLLDQVLAGIIPGYTRAAVTPGDPAFNSAIAAAFLKVLNVAKLVLDPGEAVNYAGHVTSSTLPDLLTDPTGLTPQAGKRVLGMVANGDTVIPNPQNNLLYALMGADTVLYQSGSAPGGAVPHGFLASTASAQADAAEYLDSLLVPTSPVTLP